MLNRYLDALNSAVSVAAYQLRSQGRPVYVVSTVEEAFQPDHTICEGARSWANTDNLDEITGTGPLQALVDVNELLHPNADGHLAMARALTSWSGTPAAAPVTTRSQPTWDVVVQDVQAPSALRRWAERTLALPFSGSSEVSAPGGVRADGFAPDSPVVIRLRSTPTTIAAATASVDGTIDTDVVIPRWAQPGQHTLVVLGTAPDGARIQVAHPVDVGRTGTRAATVVGILGGVLVLAGAAGVLQRHRRRRAAPAG